MSNLTAYIGKTYGPPHGCLRLAADVLRDVYGIPVPAEVADQLYTLMRNRLRPVDTPEPGDVILMKAPGWHAGVVTGSSLMIHAANETGEVVAERYDGLRWRNRVKGFYRWIN